MSELARYFANSIRLQRKRLKLTLREVSEQTGYAVSFLSDIEHGRRVVNIETLDALEDALRMKVRIYVEVGSD